MSLVTFLAQRTCATCLKQGVGEAPGSKAVVQVKQGPVRGATTTSKAPYGQCLTYPTYLVDRGRIFCVLFLRGNHLQLTLKTCRKVIVGSGVEPAPVWHKSNLAYSFSCRRNSVVLCYACVLGSDSSQDLNRLFSLCFLQKNHIYLETSYHF